MNNAEAIQELERQYLAITEYGNVTDEAKAIDKAINALSAIENIKAEINNSTRYNYTCGETSLTTVSLRHINDIIDKYISGKVESDEQEKVDDYRDRLDELEREEYYESKYGKEQE